MMRRSWIKSTEEIPLVRQCELAMVTRSTVYAACEPVKVDEDELLLCRLIDEEYTKRPFYGTRRMMVFLRHAGYVVRHPTGNNLPTLLCLLSSFCVAMTVT